MNKRGNIVLDIFLSVMVIFILITGLVFGFYIWIQFNDKLQTLPVDDPDAMTAINNMGNWFLFLDRLVPFIFIVLWIGAILSSLLVNPEHPMFFIVSLIMIFILTIVSIIFVDFGQRLFSNAIIVSVSSQLTNSMFFINNMHFISFFVMIISSVWFYSKGNSGYQQVQP